MKRIFAVLLLLTLLFGTGCGEKPVTLDPAALAAELNGAGIFVDEMNELPGAMLGAFYAVPEGVSAVLYRGTGATAEEITVFTAPDAETAKTVLAAAEKHLAELAAVYDSYNAVEAARLRDTVCVRRGSYVIVCVSNDNAKALAIIDDKK